MQRRLESQPNPDPNNWSTRRLNAIHAALPHMSRYLEIGLDCGMTIEDVTFPYRTGVDPNPKFDIHDVPAGVDIHPVPSDDFFGQLPRRTRYDVIFIDGLHTYQQTYRDIVHALRVCPHGVLLVDDVIPSDWISAIPDHEISLTERRRQGLTDLSWHGDVFKAMMILDDHHPELEWITVTDRGNPQAFVWKAARRRTRHVSRRTLASYRDSTYDDVFTLPHPAFLRAALEDDALNRVIAALGTHGSRLRRRG